jgi:hypothetical protein
MSSTEEIMEVYHADIKKQTDMVINKFGMYPFMGNLKELSWIDMRRELRGDDILVDMEYKNA